MKDLIIYLAKQDFLGITDECGALFNTERIMKGKVQASKLVFSHPFNHKEFVRACQNKIFGMGQWSTNNEQYFQKIVLPEFEIMREPENINYALFKSS